MANTQINLNGYQMKIKDNGDGTYSTTTCSQVQELTVVDALAVRDTANHDSLIDVSNQSGRKILLINNALNQPVTVLVCMVSGSGLWYTIGSKSIIGYGMITSSDIPAMQEPMLKMVVRLSCATAPTSGSVSVWLEGVSA